MHVHPADTFPMQAARLEKMHDFVVVGRLCLWQRGQMTEDIVSRSEATASKFTDDKRMAKNPSLPETLPELSVVLAEMIHPDRGIDKDHYALPTLRRRAGFSVF